MSIFPNMRRLFLSIACIVAIIGVSGCGLSQRISAITGPEVSTFAFAIDDVTVAAQAGRVAAGGRASLPPGTKLAVSVVRPLGFEQPSTAKGRPDYAILDRQLAEVEEGRWQAELSTWQTDDTGNFYEGWQLSNGDLLEGINPSPNIFLMLTLEPTEFTQGLENQLFDGIINDGETRLTYTEDGSPYLQVAQTAAMPAPLGSVVGDGSSPAALSEFWASRRTYTPSVDDTGVSELPFQSEENLALPDPRRLR